MASTYLSKTFGSDGTSHDIGTISTWVKRANLGAGTIISAGSASRTFLRFESTDNLTFRSVAQSFHLQTTQVFRDTSAWYHIVIAFDTTQSTASNRVKFYINGEQVTDFGTETYPSQNLDIKIGAAEVHNIGRDAEQTNPIFDGSMTHFHFIDGTAYDASAFGETDSTTGIWKPKTAPSVTYGTNGFFLKFENSGAFGTDSSGNGNNFTVNGTMTQTIDTPSNVFATWNSLIKTAATFSNGNTSLNNTSSPYKGSMATIVPTQGKWYGEIKVTDAANLQIGFITADTLIDGDRSLYSSSSNIYWQDNIAEIRYYLNSVSQGNATVTGGTNSTSTYTTNDIIMLAMDLDNGYGWFGKNGTWENSGNPATGTNAFNLASDYANGTTFFAGVLNANVAANFGNGYFGTTAVSSAQNPDDGIGIFEYDVPAGYRALCTKSINAEEYS